MSYITISTNVDNQSTCNACDGIITVNASTNTPYVFRNSYPVQVIGPNGYTFTFVPDSYSTSLTFTITGLCPGTYTTVVQAITDVGGSSLIKSTNDTIILSNTGCTGSGGSPCTLSTIGVVTNVTCYGARNGTVTLTSTGGTGELTYIWGIGTPGETPNVRLNIPPGVFTVEIFDTLGCRILYHYTVHDSTPVFTGTGFSNPSSCSNSDGIISVSPTGGTSPYTISIYDGTSTHTGTNVLEYILGNLPIGTYNITVTDAHSCTGTDKITLFCITELQGIIIRAKCCMADIGYKLLKMKALGKSDTKCLEIQMQYLNLAICLLERYLANNTCTDITITQINQVIEQINKVCGCCDCSFDEKMLDDTL